MSEHVDGVHRKQTILFPDTLDEYVNEGNPVRLTLLRTENDSLVRCCLLIEQGFA